MSLGSRVKVLRFGVGLPGFHCRKDMFVNSRKHAKLYGPPARQLTLATRQRGLLCPLVGRGLSLTSHTTGSSCNPATARFLTQKAFVSEQKSEQKVEADRSISNWLFAVSGLVFGMVVVGGLTRLTKSGLSMTDWKLLGQLPPMDEKGWKAEFAKYQASPEFKVLHSDMELNDFKFIYWMEYGHRQLGRVVGVAFAVPLLYFAAKGRVQRLPGMAPRLGLILCMIGAQGFIGWWMVRSGLEEPDGREVPRVSPYRLSTHLVSAFAIYTMLFTTALRARTPTAYLTVSKGGPPAMRRLAVLTAAFVGLTAASGAFVAGNSAGLCYNEWPLMGGRIVPQDIVDPKLSPAWRNFFENSTLVQFDHRWLGQGTFLLVLGVWAKSRSAASKAVLTPAARLACSGMMGVACFQVALGISTLLTYVPVSLAATHQAGSLTLLTAALWFYHCLRQPALASRVASFAGARVSQSSPARAYSTRSTRAKTAVRRVTQKDIQ